MRRAILGVVVALAACSSEPPSCEQALGHFGAAGCLGPPLNDPRQQQAEIADACEALTALVGPKCDDELDEWLRCIDGSKTYDDCHACDKQWYGGIGGCTEPPPETALFGRMR